MSSILMLAALILTSVGVYVALASMSSAVFHVSIMRSSDLGRLPVRDQALLWVQAQGLFIPSVVRHRAKILALAAVAVYAVWLAFPEYNPIALMWAISALVAACHLVPDLRSVL